MSTVAAPFISPSIKFDAQSGIAVWQILNSRTGDVEVQYPSKAVVQEYSRRGGAEPESAKAAAPVAPSDGADGSQPQPQPKAAPVPVAAAPAAASTPAPAPVVHTATPTSTIA